MDHRTEPRRRRPPANLIVGWLWHQQRLLLVRRRLDERQRAAATLRKSEAKFFEAFAHAPIGMALLSEHGSCMQVNPALCVFLGTSHDQLLARKLRDFRHPDDIDIDQSPMQQLVAGDIASYQIELRFVHHSGHRVCGLLTMALVRATQDTPKFFIAEIVDISASKEAQQRMTALRATSLQPV